MNIFTKTIARIGTAAAIAAAALLIAPTAQASEQPGRQSSAEVSAEYKLCYLDPEVGIVIDTKTMADFKGDMNAYAASLDGKTAGVYSEVMEACFAERTLPWERYRAAVEREQMAAAKPKPVVETPAAVTKPVVVKMYSTSQAKALAAKDAKKAAAKVGASKSDKSKAVKSAKAAAKKAELKAEKSSSAKKAANKAAKKVSKKSWTKSYKKAYNKSIQKAGDKAYKATYKSSYNKAVKSATSKAQKAAYNKAFTAALTKYLNAKK